MIGYEIISKFHELGYELQLKPGDKIGYSLLPGYNPDPQEAEKLINELKANKKNVIEYLQLDDKAAFNRYIKELREQNRYDPRPDLAEDSELWQAVLKGAEKMDRQLYGNLHGYRCAGAKLKWTDDGLKLITKHLIGDFWENKQEWKQDRKEFLLSYKKEITKIFKAVYQEMTKNKKLQLRTGAKKKVIV